MESALALSREDRAYHAIKVCELAARGLVPDLEDVEDPSMQAMKGSYQVLTSKLKYLIPRASAAWKPEFERVLDSSHSIRIQKIDRNRKEARRGYIGTCMACGRKEKNCRYSIDLAGDLDPARWLTHPLNVHDEYKKFSDDYDSVYEDQFLKQRIKDGTLPTMDKGCYVVGETCLRKAKLRYMLQTLFLETCYTCERDIEEMTKEGTSPILIDEIYTIKETTCADFVKYQDQLELAIADEKRAVPELTCDEEFWSVVDEARALVANDDEDEFDRIIRERAFDMMNKHKPLGERTSDVDEDDAQFCSEEQDQDEEDDTKEIPTRRSKRMRRCVIGDEDSDGDEWHAGFNERGGAPGSGQDDGRVHGSGSVEDEASPRQRCISRREAPESISGIIGKQRAVGSLPSRRNVVLQLMDLQLRLQREDRARDSLLCTNAILTLQELLQKLEEMRHTVV